MTAEVWIFYLFLTIGGARVVRLVTVDDYPPVKWVRTKWAEKVNYSDWAKLLTCIWCASPWIILVLGGLGYAAGLHGTPADLSVLGQIVWLFCAWMAISYLASMIVRRDEPDEPDEHNH